MSTLQIERPAELVTDLSAARPAIPAPTALVSARHVELVAYNPAENEFDVAVAVTRFGDDMAYSVFVDGQRPVSRYLGLLESSSEAGLSAFAEHVLTLDSSRTWRVAVSSNKFADAFAQFKAAWPHIEVVLAPNQHPVMDVAREHARRELLRNDIVPWRERRHDEQTHQRVLVATDGSSGHKGAKHRGGYAWIDENGRHGSGTITSEVPLDAEVCAIIDAINSTPTCTPMHLLTDSRSAIQVFEAALVSADTSPIRELGNGLFSKLKMALASRSVTISWIKGHAGHPLNEGADRLSRYARRSRHMEVAPSAAAQVRAGIVAESVEEWQEFLATQCEQTTIDG